VSTDSHEITVTVNGASYRRTVESRLLLSDFLRTIFCSRGRMSAANTASAAPVP